LTLGQLAPGYTSNVIFRTIIIGFYVAVAVAVGVAHGTAGLFVLGFFYAWTAAFVLLVVVGGGVVRDASRRRFPKERPTSS
jgi:hypothetical protein